MTNVTEKHDFVDSDCLEAFDHLYAYLNDEIKDKETLAKIEHHLQHCKSCFSRAEMERILNDRIKGAGNEEAPETLQNRLRDLIDTF